MRFEIANKGYIELKELHNGDLEIEYIMVNENHRGEGVSNKLLDMAMDLGVNLVAYIEPHPKSSLTYEDEVKWLCRRGFVSVNDYNFGDCIRDVMFWKMCG